jgi:Phage-integrase repeat unit
LRFRPFNEARQFVHSLDLKGQTAWNKYCKSGKKPQDIPANPRRTYKQEWKGWGDWLGTGRIANQNKQYRSFAEAREFVHTLELKNKDHWLGYIKSARKPADIPAYPDAVYKHQFKSWRDWLGTGFIAPQKRQYRSFEKAREFIRLLRLKSWEEWRAYLRSGEMPPDIPSTPDRVYENEFRGMEDWLGYNIDFGFQGK